MNDKSDKDISIQKMIESQRERGKVVRRNLKFGITLSGPLLLLAGIFGILNPESGETRIHGQVVTGAEELYAHLAFIGVGIFFIILRLTLFSSKYD